MNLSGEGGPPDRFGQIRWTLGMVLALNLVVVGIKVAAWILTGSLSVAGEVVHSSLDAANNVMALAFAKISGQKADAEHPYGHAKFETLGALVVAAFLSITVFEIFSGAVRRLMGGAAPTLDVSPLALGLMVLSLLVAILVAAWEGRQARFLSSPILAADAAHTRSDVLGTLAVLGGLILVRAGFPYADPLVALGVAALIARSGWRIIREAVPILVDERAVEPDVIAALALGVPGVVQCREIRSRGPQGSVFVEMVIEVDGKVSVTAGHAIADQVESLVASELGAKAVSVHVEPGQAAEMVDR